MTDRKTLLISLSILVIMLNIHYTWGCVHEQQVLGSAVVESLMDDHDYYVMDDEARFIPLDSKSLNPLKVYTVQAIKKTSINPGDFNQYNKTHIKYYRYARLKDFLNQTEYDFYTLGYEQVVIGQSLEGRDLYSVRPINFDGNKKTILMFGRHHGDEGTANWIIEGFIEEFLKADSEFHKNYQLVLYPMINPDGTEVQSRYNSKNRDLNRSWDFKVANSYDEAKTINKDLQFYLKDKQNIVIVLDMHGSISEDFIYRVKKDYVSLNFYNHQQKFINELQSWDKFQAGHFILSNGHPKMARIVLINSYGLHALTHETIKNIKLKNPNGRSLKTLKEQGIAVLKSIQKLY